MKEIVSALACGIPGPAGEREGLLVVLDVSTNLRARSTGLALHSWEREKHDYNDTPAV